ncbi:hypothetical protein GCM10009804_58320 [Kribbella hippodromi]|uniref:DUF6286 domain-containing protein n=1 Tax=Kribbella hippodromi TaxID=434347 RepID=A0ABP4PXD0_9ACTN
MADAVALTRSQPLRTATATAAADHGERGSLEISPRAIERIAETAALQAPGVIRQDATFGRGLPKAEAKQAGRRLRIDLAVAVEWGYPLSGTAAEARNQVARKVADLTGLGVDVVNVDISAVTPPRPRTEVRSLKEVRMSHAAAKKPVAVPAASTVGVIAAIAVTAVGAVGVRDTLVATGAMTGESWLGWLFGKTEVLKAADWMIYAGAASLLIGLWILIAALKPRRATHLALGESHSGVWIRGRDAARLATDTARGIDSVTSAMATAKGRKLRIKATALADAERVHDELTAAVAQRLNAVTPEPRVRSRVVVEEH